MRRKSSNNPDAAEPETGDEQGWNMKRSKLIKASEGGVSWNSLFINSFAVMVLTSSDPPPSLIGVLLGMCCYGGKTKKERWKPPPPPPPEAISHDKQLGGVMKPSRVEKQRTRQRNKSLLLISAEPPPPPTPNALWELMSQDWGGYGGLGGAAIYLI